MDHVSGTSSGEVLQEQINEAMRKYDAGTTGSGEGEPVVDDDGFTLGVSNMLVARFYGLFLRIAWQSSDAALVAGRGCRMGKLASLPTKHPTLLWQNQRNGLFWTFTSSNTGIESALVGGDNSWPVFMLCSLYCVELLELRRKFEQDKAKIAQMRAQRRFRPY